MIFIVAVVVLCIVHTIITYVLNTNSSFFVRHTEQRKDFLLWTKCNAFNQSSECPPLFVHPFPHELWKHCPILFSSSSCVESIIDAAFGRRDLSIAVVTGNISYTTLLACYEIILVHNINDYGWIFHFGPLSLSVGDND